MLLNSVVKTSVFSAYFRPGQQETSLHRPLFDSVSWLQRDISGHLVRQDTCSTSTSNTPKRSSW